MTAAYDLARARRLVLLLSAAAKALSRGGGVPLARAVELTGARGEKQLLADIAALERTWVDPAEGEQPIQLYVEDGAVQLLYPTLLGARPPAFSLAEAAVLRAALAPFEPEGGRAARQAVAKLRKAVPEPLREAADRLARGLEVVTPAGPWAGALHEAIARRVETMVDYCAVADGAATRRTVEPRALFHREGRWYLAAWNVEKGEEHLFRLDRIAQVELGTRVFGEHKGPPLARYTRRHLFFESGAEREVTIRFRGTAARLQKERHGTRARENADGSVSVTVRVTPGNYLTGIVLGYGGEAELEGPADVREALQARVEQLRALYVSR
jgi:proteasome accessory factor C